MQRFFIITMNCTLLFFLLIGFPAAVSSEFGSMKISPAHAARLLTVCGLAAALGGNILAAIFFIKARKEKNLCWEWAAVFGALLLAQWAFTSGYLNFEWLKNSLLWLQKYF